MNDGFAWNDYIYEHNFNLHEMIGWDTLLSCGLNFKVENAYTLKCGNIYGHENPRFRDWEYE